MIDVTKRLLFIITCSCLGHLNAFGATEERAHTENEASAPHINALILKAESEDAKAHHHRAIRHLESALALALTAEKKALSAKLYVLLATQYRKVRQYDDALKYATRGVSASLTLENDAMLRYLAYGSLGQVYVERNTYQQAIDSFLTSYEYARKINNNNVLVSSLTRLAEAYAKQNMPNRAVEYYTQAIDLSPDASLPTLSLYINLAYVHKREGRSKRAQELEKHAFDILEKAQDNTFKLKAYRQLAAIYSAHEDLETSLSVNKQALAVATKLAKKEHSQEILAIQLEHIATDQRKLALYSEALDNAQKALTLCRYTCHENRIASLLQNMSIIYRRLSQFDEALTYANELIAIRERQGDFDKMASAYNTMGLIYSNLERNDDSSQYFTATLELPEGKVSKKYRAQALRALADVFEKSHLHDKALEYAYQALTLYGQIDSTSGEESVHRSLGKIYQAMGDKAKALEAFKTALKQAREIKNTWSEGDALVKIALLQARTQAAQAMTYAHKALKLGEETKSKSLMLDAYLALALAEEARGHFRQANEYNKRQYQLLVDISESEINQRVAELQVARETNKKERELSDLRHKDQMNKLKLTNASTELEALQNRQRVSELEIDQIKLFRILLLVFSFAVLVALFFIWNRYRLAKAYQNTLNIKNTEIEEKNHKLEELNYSKDQFLSLIAHDLRGPVSATAQLSALLADNLNDYSGERLQCALDEIRNASEQTHILLDDLLEWGLNQIRHSTPNFQRVSLPLIVLPVIESMASKARQKNIHLHTNVDKDLFVYVDKGMISTVVRNLLSNAIKFSKEGKDINVECQATHQQKTFVHVKDQGIGIPSQYLDNIFDLENCFSRSGTQDEQGTGFGLSLCKDLVRKNGGEIAVKSREFEGTDFYFSLPSVPN